MKLTEKMKIVTGGIAFCALLGAFVGCSQTDYLIYDDSFSGIYFTKDTIQYSFGVTPVETLQYTLKIPVQIMGVTSSESRVFAYEIIPDSTTAEEGVQYLAEEGYIYPDSITGYIPLVLLRNGLEGNYTDGYVHYTVGVKLVENNNFTPTLSSTEQIRVVTFDNAIEQPEWYDYWGNKVWSVSELGVWHPLKLIKMVEYFHELEDILPETYYKMVELYGENLENIPYGSPTEYMTTFRKYIYYPMYTYFSDPDNRDYILSLYPDFPFDFPNPFGDDEEE